MSAEPLPADPDTDPDTDPEPGSDTERASAPAPLLQLLQLPGLPAPTGDARVCGPDGCAVPQPGTGPAETARDR